MQFQRASSSATPSGRRRAAETSDGSTGPENESITAPSGGHSWLLPLLPPLLSAALDHLPPVSAVAVAEVTEVTEPDSCGVVKVTTAAFSSAAPSKDLRSFRTARLKHRSDGHSPSTSKRAMDVVTHLGGGEAKTKRKRGGKAYYSWTFTLKAKAATHSPHLKAPGTVND